MKMQNKKIMKNKRAGVSISILVLVIATLVLTGYSLMAFLSKKQDTTAYIGCYSGLESFYVREERIRFFLNELTDIAIDNSRGVDYKSPLDLNKFKESFNKMIALTETKNKDIFPELSQVKEQIKDNNFLKAVFYDPDSGIFNMNLDITLTGSIVNFDNVGYKACQVGVEHKFRVEIKRSA